VDTAPRMRDALLEAIAEGEAVFVDLGSVTSRFPLGAGAVEHVAHPAADADGGSGQPGCVEGSDDLVARLRWVDSPSSTFERMCEDEQRRVTLADSVRCTAPVRRRLQDL
jgi:hypothetical protein